MHRTIWMHRWKASIEENGVLRIFHSYFVVVAFSLCLYSFHTFHISLPLHTKFGCNNAQIMKSFATNHAEPFHWCSCLTMFRWTGIIADSRCVDQTSVSVYEAIQNSRMSSTFIIWALAFVTKREVLIKVYFLLFRSNNWRWRARLCSTL